MASPSPDSSPAVRRRWAITGVVATAILVLSIVPNPPDAATLAVPIGEPDTWLHAVGYAIFGGTLAAALAADQRAVDRLLVGASPRDRSGRFVIAILAGSLAFGYGLGIEIVQLSLPGRLFEVSDVVANGAGAGIGSGLWTAGMWLRE